MPLFPDHQDRQLTSMMSNVSSDSSSDHFNPRKDKLVNLTSKLDAKSLSTPPRRTAPGNTMVVSPDITDASVKSLSDDSSHTGSTGSEVDEFDASTVIKRIGKSDHKIAEEQGFPVQEPLLKENPHRFVLFPIADNEARQLMILLWVAVAY